MDDSSNPAHSSSNDSDIKKAKKRVRSVNFSQKECDVLVDLVTKYQHIIENRRSDGATWKAKEVAWDKIREEFNLIAGNEIRSTQSIRFKYETMKKKAKKERLLPGLITPTLSPALQEKIRILQESRHDLPVNENSVDLVRNNPDFESVTEIKKEMEDTADSNGVDSYNIGSETNQHSEDDGEEDDTNKVSNSKSFVEEREMRKKEHDFKMGILRLKMENQLKEAQEHDLRIQSLKLDLEIKRRQLKLMEFKNLTEI